MKIVLLVWLACFAVWLEIVARSNRAPVAPTLPWPFLILSAALVASIIWTVWLMTAATAAVHSLATGFWSTLATWL
jgi:hypothetical protein